MDPELKAYLEQGFGKIDQRVSSMDSQYGSLDQQIREVGRQIQKLGDDMDKRLDKLETEIRGAYVAIEGLRDDIKLVAEGVVNLNEQLKEHRTEFSEKLADVESLTRRSYEDLDTRVRRLEAAG